MAEGGFQPRVLSEYRGGEVANDHHPATKGRLSPPFPSLADLSKGAIYCWLQQLTCRSSNTFWHNAGKFKDFLVENLVSHLRQSLLDLVIQLVRGETGADIFFLGKVLLM